MRRIKPWWVLFLLPIIPLWKVVLQGEAIGPWEQIRQFAPWYGQAPQQPWDVLQADGALQFYVWRDLVFAAWSKLQIPFWNPYELAGTPLLANSQSGALYPPHILLGILHVPTTLAITLLAWFHLAMAGLGTYRLAKHLGAGEAGGLVAGCSFALCPFMVSWTALASVITTVCWIPWALALTFEALDRPRARTLGLLAIAVAFMFLGGHLQFAAYGCLALAVIGLSRARAGLRPIGGWIMACIAGVVIASPQLFAVLDYGQFSHRRGTPTEEGYTAYSASALKPWQLGNLVNPLGLGDPRVTPGDARVSSYWPALVKPGDNFAESAVAPGAVAVAFLCFAPFAIRRFRGAGALAVVGALGLLLAMGSPLTRLMYFLVPGWSSTGSPGRAIVLFVLAACILAGIAAGALFEPESRPRNPKLLQFAALLFAFVTAGTIGIGITGAQTPPGADHDAFQALVATASSSGLFLTLFLAAVGLQPAVLGYFRGRGPGTVPTHFLVAIGVAACALLSGGTRWVMTGQPVEFVHETGFERIAIVNADWDLLMSGRSLMPSNLAALFRVHELGGYDSLLHRDTVEMLKEVVGGDPAPAANGNMMYIKPSAEPEKLAAAGVTQMWTLWPRQGLGQADGSDDRFPRQVIEGPGRVSIEVGEATIVAEDFGSVTVKVSGSGKLTLRDRWMPGWNAKVDGAAAEVPEGRWMEITVPEGSQTVVFSYRPRNFMPLSLLAILTLLGVGIAIWRSTNGEAAPDGKIGELPSEQELNGAAGRT